MVDLCSDTVTQLTRAIRLTMIDAVVRDDVFGESPTSNQLEEYVTALLGKEAALYRLSGPTTNLIGVCLLRPVAAMR